MKKIIFLAVFLAANLLISQNPETNSRNWTVTKLANTNQLVSYPNEITYGPDGWLWITERAAQDGTSDATNGERIVRVHPDTGVKTEMIDLHTEVDGYDGQDGLMGMAIHPDLMANPNTTTNNFVYAAHTYGAQSSLKLRIIKLSYDNSTKLLTKLPGSLIENIDATNDHNSGRMKIGPDGKLYYTIGDLGANQFRNKCNIIQSQALPTAAAIASSDWSTYKGKILRMNLDGSIPSDNPVFFPFSVTNSNPIPDNLNTNKPDADKVRSHIYSYGHRNAQGIVFDSAGKLYQSEHGDRVDDELNIITAGKNYGWPLIAGQRDAQAYSYCIKASVPSACSNGSNECPTGAIIHEETDFPEPVDFQGPISTYLELPASRPTGGFLTWPSIAPSSIDIYETGSFPWNKNVIIPTLKKGTLYRYELSADGNSVASELIEFHSSNDRYRDVAFSPDGTTIYAVTDSGGSTSGPSGSINVGVTNPGAVFKIEYQSFPEPSNQVTNFIATENGTDIVLNWNDVVGTNLADGYAISISTTAGSFPTYTDGVEPMVDLDLTDGSGLVLVKNGNESYLFDDLDENTAYYFQIRAYANLNNDIDFLNSTAAPEASATTTISLDPTIIITEVVSRSIDESFVEIFNHGTLPVNLNTEGFYLAIRYDGGSGSDQVDINVTLQPGEYYTIGRASGSLTPDLTAWNVINGDGNDPYILYNGNDEIVDIYGVANQNGNGQAWEYTNSRAIRKITVSEASNTWIASEWIIESISGFSDVTPNAGEDLSFIYNNGWAPYDPSGSSYQAENVTIQNGTATLTDKTLFLNATVQPGATFDLGNNEVILTQDLQNNGTIDGNDGTLIFSGASNQVINGNNFEIGHLEVNNPINVNADIAINNALSVNDNLTINLSNMITLRSTATGTAFVDEVNGTISGNFMTERFMSARRAFRFVSPSVNTSTSIYDNWQEGGSNVAGFGTHITGSSTGANGFDATVSGGSSLFEFVNTAQFWNATSNTDMTNLVAGTPYRLFVRGDRTTDLTINNAVATATTLRSSGTLITGTHVVNDLSGIAGEFNFIGNPYHAPVNLSQVLAASTNVNPNFVYFWDPTVNERGAYVTVDVPANSTSITSNYDRFLQPNSSFFTTTLANGAASMTFEESYKEVSQEALNIFAAPNNSSKMLVRLYEQNEFNNGLKERDGLAMIFTSNGNNGLDINDALKFSNIDESLSIANQGELLSIEKRSIPQDGDLVQLNNLNYRASQYVLEVNMNGVITPAYIFDTFTQTYTSLSQTGNSTYEFTVDNSNAASSDANRLQIVFSNQTLSNDEVLNRNTVTVYPNPTKDHVIQITGIEKDTILSLYNMLGQEIIIPSNAVNFNGNGTSVQLPSSLTRGTYLLRLSQGNNIMVEKIVVE